MRYSFFWVGELSSNGKGGLHLGQRVLVANKLSVLEKREQRAMYGERRGTRG